MLWLFVIISAYFIFAITALIDRYLLIGPPNPKSYSFYVGVLGISVFVLAPFVNFSVPETSQILLALLAGAIFIFAFFWFYTGLENFEVSRVVPAISGILPLFTFSLVYLFSGGKGIFSLKEISAFSLLILGSVLITFERKPLTTFQKLPLETNTFSKKWWGGLKVSVIAAFLFSLAFVLSKYVYLVQPFWSGFIWMRIGGFLAGLCFLFTREVRKEIFLKKFTFKKRTGTLFLFNQGMGAGAFILQNFAIALAGLAYLPFINALEGLKYVFLFLIIIFLTKKFPGILEEKLTKKVISQKVISIIFIALGLAILSL